MKHRIYVLPFMLLVLLNLSGCDRVQQLISGLSDSEKGDAADKNDAVPDATADTAQPPSADRSAAPAPEKEPVAKDTAAQSADESSSLSIPGIPDLDVSIGPNLSDVDREESQQLNQKAVKLYRKKDYAGAEPLFLKALEKNPSNLVFRYNLACIASLTENTDRALAVLRQFKETPECPRCFIMLANATEDKDFDNIRENATFKELVAGAPEKLAAELKLAKWISYDAKNSSLPIRTEGLPAIADDGSRIAVVNRFKNGYRMQIVMVSTGEVSTSAILLNDKELEQLKNGEVEPKNMRPRIKERIDNAHKKMLGRNWIEFSIKSTSIAPTWLKGRAQQRFQLGNSTVKYRYPNLEVTNSEGRITVEDKIGHFPEDDCTDLAVLSEAYVNGQFHVMLFYQLNVTKKNCTPQGGEYHIIQVTGE